MGPEIIIAGLTLAGASAVGLWKIALTLGRYEGSTTQVLKTLTGIVADHETRLRTLERSDGVS